MIQKMHGAEFLISKLLKLEGFAPSGTAEYF